ncbi:hypothetical protein GW17_00035915 [Ensete ventricosum]|nr:hypothetical protein GW17_00035915 [Ensete ventricosum]
MFSSFFKLGARVCDVDVVGLGRNKIIGVRITNLLTIAKEDVGEETSSCDKRQGTTMLLVQEEKAATIMATTAWAVGRDGEKQRPRWWCRQGTKKGSSRGSGDRWLSSCSGRQ